MYKPKRIIILGSTGSVGQQALDVIGQYPHLFDVVALVANSQWALLAQQARQFKPKAIALLDQSFLPNLKDSLAGEAVDILGGEEGIIEAILRGSDILVSAIVGFAGLKPTFVGLEHTRCLAIANKESIVVGGEWLLEKARQLGVQVVPVDSEHNSLFQLLQADRLCNIDKLIITASGGPFRGMSRQQLKGVTLEAALCHPTWRMGPKNTIDSATLFNKGLELIEACRLYEWPQQRIEAWVHPQSIVHAVLQLTDHSLLFHASRQSMKIPLAHALAWPDRIPCPDLMPLSLGELSRLVFEPIDEESFPAISLARQSLDAGSGACIVYNVVNECAVHAFMNGRMTFLDIMSVVQQALDKIECPVLGSVDDALMFSNDVRRSFEDNILKLY